MQGIKKTVLQLFKTQYNYLEDKRKSKEVRGQEVGKTGKRGKERREKQEMREEGRSQSNKNLLSPPQPSALSL